MDCAGHIKKLHTNLAARTALHFYPVATHAALTTYHFFHSTKFKLSSPVGVHEPPSLSTPAPCAPACCAMGEEPPTLLAHLMACQEHTALLTHSSSHRLA